MTRVLFDLQQQVYNDYVHTNIAGGTVEDHTADPDVIIERTILRTPITNNTNGKIVFVKATPATSIELGPSRHKIWFVEGYIQHHNLTIFDDATIMSMKAEMERLLNVYNNTVGTYVYLFVTSDGYNEDPVNAMYDFVIEITEYGVTALA